MTPRTLRIPVLLIALAAVLSVTGVAATPTQADATTASRARAAAVRSRVPTIVTAEGIRYRPVSTDVAVPAPPVIRARGWAIADFDTGRILAAYRGRTHLPQASTIKLLTALTAAETVRRFPRHRVTRAEAHPQYCTCVGLRVGRRYGRAALLAGMLLPSANDAAEALAGSHPRGRAAFVAAMNAKAAALGATGTHVVTPSGLTAAGAYSTARDLLVFLRAAQASPVVEPFLARSRFRFGPLGGRRKVIYRGTDYVNTYAGVNVGTEGKSGYTTPALNTLVVDTPINGHRIAVATMGAPGGYSTTGARALTLWAAANYDALAGIGRMPALPHS